MNATRQPPTLPRAVASRIERQDWERRNTVLLMAQPPSHDQAALLWSGRYRGTDGIVPHARLRDVGSGSRSGPVWLHGPDSDSGSGFMLMLRPRRRPRFTGGKRQPVARQRQRVARPMRETTAERNARERRIAGTVAMGSID